jgi:hypothetical protein
MISPFTRLVISPDKASTAVAHAFADIRIGSDELMYTPASGCCIEALNFPHQTLC